MPIGLWADTQKIFRPGIAVRGSANQSAVSINTAMMARFTPQNRAKWLKSGTFVNFDTVFSMRDLYVLGTRGTAPANPQDPNDPKYDWSLLDSYLEMEFLSPANCGPGLMLQMFHTAGHGPGWFNNAHCWTNSDGKLQVKYWEAAAVQALKDLFSAMYTRYATTYKWWVIGLAEHLAGASSAWPAGMTNVNVAQGKAEIVNHIDSLYGGKIWAGFGSQNQEGASYCVPLSHVHNPDPKITPLLIEYMSGNTGAWPQAFMMREHDNRLCKQGVEPNGLGYGRWPDGFENPFGNTATLPPPGYHYPTTDELGWIFSAAGPCPVHLLVIGLVDGTASQPNGAYLMTVESWNATLDKYMASGSDIIPYLPPSYTITPAPDEGGQYTHVADGTLVSSTGNFTVLPPSRSVGDLLLCATAVYTVGETLNVPSGWTVLERIAELVLLARIATDTGTTSASPDAIVNHNMWSGTSNGRAQIAAFSGDVPASLNDIIAASVSVNTTTNTANIPTGALDLVEDNRLVISLAKKNKSIASAITLSAPSGISNIIGQASGTTANTLFGWGYTIQTTVTDLTASSWGQNNADDKPSLSLTVALKAASAVVVVPDQVGTLTFDNVTQNSMRVKFTDVSTPDATSYRLYKSLDAATVIDPPQFVREVTQAVKTTDGGINITGLVAARNYGWQVSAVNAAGEGALSSEVQQATSTPADTEDPTYSGLTTITYDEDSQTFTLTHTQGSDDLTTQANLQYDLYVSTDTISYTAATNVFGAATSFTVPRDELIGRGGGTLTAVMRCRDEAGRDDGNTIERTVSVPALPNVLVEACDNGSGSPKTGDVYAQFVLSGQAFNINVEDPAATCELITLDENGQYRFYADPGIYQWKYLDVSEYETSGDRDDIWTAEGWCEVEE